jgi:hypothetical protein
MNDSQRPSLFTSLRVLILDNVQGFGLNLYTRNGCHLCQCRIVPTRPSQNSKSEKLLAAFVVDLPRVDKIVFVTRTYQS